MAPLLHRAVIMRLEPRQMNNVIKKSEEIMRFFIKSQRVMQPGQKIETKRTFPSA